MKRSLSVFWKHEQVGELSGQDEVLAFCYDKAWLHSQKASISLAMPLREAPYQKEAKAFFSNLLPEGDFRQRVERIFKVSAGNDYSLLEEIGGDCAGALTLGGGDDEESAFYEPVDDEQLERIVKTEGLAGLGQAGQANRLSLAGAQGKLPVRVRDSVIEIPRDGAASTHILKFNRHNGDYPRLVENEYYMNRLAQHLGLQVVPCELKSTPSGTILIIERYDRTFDEWPERIHQEDFCQALSCLSIRKYEKEGGPSFADCVQLARQHLGLIAVGRLLDWFLFNALTGNSDAHAKNISIVHGAQGYTLAPFYDLVCTRAYERLDRKLAMAFGGEFDPDRLGPKQVDALAKATGITKRLIRTRLAQLMKSMPEAQRKALEDFKAQGFSPAVLEHATQAQTKIFRRLETSLRG